MVHVFLRARRVFCQFGLLRGLCSNDAGFIANSCLFDLLILSWEKVNLFPSLNPAIDKVAEIWE